MLGTFGTYFREHRSPTDMEKQSVAALASVAAEAIALGAVG